MSRMRDDGLGGISLPVRACDADTDRLGHVNNAVYLRRVEAATHHHWCSLANVEELAAYDWIAIRHEIDYRLPAYAGNDLTVETRVVEIRRARAWYETVVWCGDAILMEARSCWGCIDMATSRLTAIPEATAVRFLGKNGTEDTEALRFVHGT